MKINHWHQMKRNLVIFFILLVTLGFFVIGCGSSGSAPDQDDNGSDGSETVPSAAYLTLQTSKTAIKTDGEGEAAITANVLDKDRVPIEGAEVSIHTTGGKISASTLKTDADGEATVKLATGGDKRNHTIVVTATIDGKEQSIPIAVTGSQVTLNPSSGQMLVGGSQEEVTVTVKDAADIPVYGTEVKIELKSGDQYVDDALLIPKDGEESSGSHIIEGQTDLDGQYSFILQAGSDSGKIAGITAEALNTTADASFDIAEQKDIFEITDYDQSVPADGNTKASITVSTGEMTTADTLVFASSFPSSISEETLILKDGPEYITFNDSGDAVIQFSSERAGTATVEAYNKNKPDDEVDSVQISFYNPASEASGINIQSEQANILPSTSTTKQSLTIIAEVTADGHAPVGDALVRFSLSNTTGGGEYVDPVSVYTDSKGIAKTTFTSGTLGSGARADQDESQAVTLHASVATYPDGTGNPAVFAEDTVEVVIHENAANVNIGLATQIETNEENTQYILPVSVLVADVNGNPVSGKTVSLSLRPSYFYTGAWVWLGDKDGWSESPVRYNPKNPGDNSLTDYLYGFAFPPEPYKFVNEDLNRNTYLDNDEDQADAYSDYYESGDWIPGLDNGHLDPGQSTAGNIPSSVLTDENGVATFTLRYLKQYAVWLQAEITASTTVFGTEYDTVTYTNLPASASEIESDILQNTFPQSPFNNLVFKQAE